MSWAREMEELAAWMEEIEQKYPPCFRRKPYLLRIRSKFDSEIRLTWRAGNRIQ